MLTFIFIFGLVVLQKWLCDPDSVRQKVVIPLILCIGPSRLHIDAVTMGQPLLKRCKWLL